MKLSYYGIKLQNKIQYTNSHVYTKILSKKKKHKLGHELSLSRTILSYHIQKSISFWWMFIVFKINSIDQRQYENFLL